MDTKHTPGPWYVNTNGSLSEYAVCAEVFGSGFSSSVAVAMQRDNKARNPISPDEALANASLIAVAPELLEALLSAQDLILNRWGYPADSSGRDSSLRQIGAAIAKATGVA